jgi:hypothetical protein
LPPSLTNIDSSRERGRKKKRERERDVMGLDGGSESGPIIATSEYKVLSLLGIWLSRFSIFIHGLEMMYVQTANSGLV